MTTEELRLQNELADQLLSKLQAIKEAWEELPTIDDLNEYDKVLGSIASTSFDEFTAAWEGLPSLDDVQEYSKAVGEIES